MTRYLLDTNVLLWTLLNDEHLPQNIIDVLMSNRNQLYYSSASVWEVELKHQKKKDFKLSGKQLSFLCNQNGLLNININDQHIIQLGELKSPNSIEHNDPFDKMLLSQAICEKMIFITHDHKFKNYDYSNILYF